MFVPVSLVRCVGRNIAALVGLGLSGAVAVAQVAESPPITLHVYTDLLQIPVLVLDEGRQPMLGLNPKQFRLSVDSGPLFQPPYVRREGEDPLALQVLVDASTRGAQAEARLAAAVGGLSTRSLMAQDGVALEALHACGASRTESFNVTAGAAMERKMVMVLNARDRAPAGATCAKPQPLWDMMAEACERLGRESGRRVLLVITDGADHGSRISWRELRRLATARSVAIFGVTLRQETLGDKAAATHPDRITPELSPLQALCELTGGVQVLSSSAGLGDALQSVIRMVRERYILEFARPARMGVGAHDLAVNVSKSGAMVRPAGISFPQKNTAEQEAGNAIEGDGTRAPKPGTRRVLSAIPPP